jgi:uncharacterized membrane protein
MKVLKLTIGILSLVLSLFVIFQSCAAGLANALSDNGETSGTAGAFLAVLWIAGGIVGIVTRSSTAKGGSVASAILYLIAALIGFVSAGSYTDLYIWSGLSVVFAIVFIISIFIKPKQRSGDVPPTV